MRSALVIVGLFLAALVWPLLRGVLTSLLAGEIKGALAAYLERRVQASAAKLEPDRAAEHEGEWLAELSALQDRPIRALLFVRGLARAARAIALEDGAPAGAAADPDADAAIPLVFAPPPPISLAAVLGDWSQTPAGVDAPKTSQNIEA